MKDSFFRNLLFIGVAVWVFFPFLVIYLGFTMPNAWHFPNTLILFLVWLTLFLLVFIGDRKYG